MRNKTQAKLPRSRKKQVAIHSISAALSATAVVIFILGLSYVLVPFYQYFCQTTGFGGTVQNASPYANSAPPTAPPMGARSVGKKPITIHFNADTADGLPWNFQPSIDRVLVYPGDTALTFYIAQNPTNAAISGISTYHVSPPQVGIYFNKIQCFCYEEQRLKPNESIEMPILFFIDSEFEEDPKMRDVDTIILSYTLYQAAFNN